jgi:hypothetical protein
MRRLKCSYLKLGFEVRRTGDEGEGGVENRLGGIRD